jgi:hypothetical protein
VREPGRGERVVNRKQLGDELAHRLGYRGAAGAGSFG